MFMLKYVWSSGREKNKDAQITVFKMLSLPCVALSLSPIRQIDISDPEQLALNHTKYLQCPAVFTVQHLKKFVQHKFSIDATQFCVEIMYKVKTIVLPDHYTLMDVAYIYTWKRVSGVGELCNSFFAEPVGFFVFFRSCHYAA